MHFRGIPLNGALSFLVKIPLFMPYLVTAFVFWVLLYPKGYVGIIFKIIFVEYFRLMEEAPPSSPTPTASASLYAARGRGFPTHSSSSTA